MAIVHIFISIGAIKLLETDDAQVNSIGQIISLLSFLSLVPRDVRSGRAQLHNSVSVVAANSQRQLLVDKPDAVTLNMRRQGRLSHALTTSLARVLLTHLVDKPEDWSALALHPVWLVHEIDDHSVDLLKSGNEVKL